MCEPLCAGDPPPKGPSLDAYYWVAATLAEALAGDARQKAVLDRAYALDVAQWMKDSTRSSSPSWTRCWRTRR